MMTQNRSNQNGTALMEQIRAVDFALQETVLYLDAYPDNRQALSYYHRLMEEHNRLLNEYQSHFGPLTMYGNHSKTSWDWIEGPWPWEAAANEGMEVR